MNRTENPAALRGAHRAREITQLDSVSSFTKSPSLFQVQNALNSGAITYGLAALIVATWARLHLGLEAAL